MINCLDDRKTETWYANTVLMPQIQALDYKTKCFIWANLFSEMHFEDAFSSIINYNLTHQADIQKMKDRCHQHAVVDIMPPDQCITIEHKSDDVWHTVAEHSPNKGPLIVESNDGNFYVANNYDRFFHVGAFLLDTARVKRWAYAKDLIPKEDGVVSD